MKSFKNLFAVPQSPTKSSLMSPFDFISCKQCKKRFKRSDHSQDYCSVNCERMQSWLSMNEAHSRKQARLSRVHGSDASIPGSSRASLDKLLDPRPRSPAQSSFRPSSDKDRHGSPRRVVRTRTVSTFDASRRSPSFLPPPLPSPACSSPRRAPSSIPPSSSESEIANTDAAHHSDAPESPSSTRLTLPHLSSPELSMAAPKPTITPFLARKPSYPISSTARHKPSPTRSITLTPGPAPPTPPPDRPTRRRQGFERRAPRPRSNSFGGFQALTMHAPRAFPL